MVYDHLFLCMFDTGMMFKLQSRIKDLERERKQLLADLEQTERRPRSESQFSDIAFDQQKSLELEMENSRLRGMFGSPNNWLDLLYRNKSVTHLRPS